MKYCVRYTKGFRYFDKVDEIILEYKKTTPELVDMVQTYADNQRVIVDLREFDGEFLDENLVIFKDAAAAHSNIAFLLSKTLASVQLEDKLKGYNMFYDIHVNTPDKLAWCIERGVSDIYLTDELAFAFEDIYKLYGDKVIFRLYPNVGQTSYIENNPLKKFFIRPEDVKYYNYDNVVFEFFGPDDRQSVLYEIYNSGRWIGRLPDLILELNENANLLNETIYPLFGLMRSHCGKRCLTKGQCDVCMQAKVTSDILEEANIVFKEQKENNDR